VSVEGLTPERFASSEMERTAACSGFFDELGEDGIGPRAESDLSFAPANSHDEFTKTLHGLRQNPVASEKARMTFLGSIELDRA
jgi:hypothetical protein